MESFISFVLRFNLDFMSVLIILNKRWGVMYKRPLYNPTDLAPRLALIISIKSHLQLHHPININSNMRLLSHPL